MATKEVEVKKADIKKSVLATANKKSDIKSVSKILEGNKNFSFESLAKVENTSKRLIILKEVINNIPLILKGKEVTFNLKKILGSKGKASDYIADSLPRKVKSYIEEKLGISLVLSITKVEGKKVKEFTLRKAEKLLK